MRSALIEIWQANAAGRYVHDGDQHPAPLDPNFTGAGRCADRRRGRYRFVTIKPGAYPWRNHANAWRPRTSTSRSSAARSRPPRDPDVLPGRPALRAGPDLQVGARPEGARPAGLLVRPRDDVPEWALGYRFDIVLGGRRRRRSRNEPGDTVADRRAVLLDRALRATGDGRSSPDRARAIVGSRVRRRGRADPDAMVEIWQADAEGRYRGDFGWGRCGTRRRKAASRSRSVKPGAVDGRRRTSWCSVFARGLLKPVLTRMYFPDERRRTTTRSSGRRRGRDRADSSRRARMRSEFDVRLQGDRQTAFFAL